MRRVATPGGLYTAGFDAATHTVQAVCRMERTRFFVSVATNERTRVPGPGENHNGYGRTSSGVFRVFRGGPPGDQPEDSPCAGVAVAHTPSNMRTSPQAGAAPPGAGNQVTVTATRAGDAPVGLYRRDRGEVGS